MIRILYDGWPLIHHPNGPAALHFLAVLAHMPAEVDAQVALPAEGPDWLSDWLSRKVVVHVRACGGSSRDRLRWEQGRLPRLARELDAQLLHLAEPAPALFGSGRAVLSPAGYAEPDRRMSAGGREARDAASQRRGFFERLRLAAAAGGLSRVKALLWPEDLPAPPGWDESTSPRLFHLPPVFLPEFFPASQPAEIEALDLPETFVLYHGPGDPAGLRRLLDAWSWVAGSLGEQYPLLLVGLDAGARRELETFAVSYGIEATVRSLPALTPAGLAFVYRNCSVLFHPAPISVWGGPLRPALAAGKPVVADETPLASALVGPAAYLAPPGDPRLLGSALITVLVEDSLADHLSQIGRERAAAWNAGSFGERLLDAYRLVLS